MGPGFQPFCSVSRISVVHKECCPSEPPTTTNWPIIHKLRDYYVYSSKAIIQKNAKIISHLVIKALTSLPFLTANPHPRLAVERGGPCDQVLFAGS